MRPKRLLRYVPLWIGLLLPWASMDVAVAQTNIESLIQKLSHADPAVRGEALRGLEALPAKVVVPKAIEALKTADKAVAERLVRVLAYYPDPSEAEPLIELAKKYDGLGAEVFQLLGGAGTRVLMSAAEKNCDANVGDISFLSWAGDTAAHAGPDARVVLLEATKAKNACTRIAGLCGLAKAPTYVRDKTEESEREAAVVVALLADPVERVSKVAENLLTPSAPGWSYGYQIADFASEPLLKFFAAEKDPSLRVRVLHILTNYAESSVQELMDQLANDADPSVREIAKNYQPPRYEEERRERGESPQAGVTPSNKLKEIERLTKSKNPQDRTAAAEEMGKSGDVTNTEGLVKLLKDPNATVREKAATGLGDLNGYFEDAAIQWNGNRADSAPALYMALDDSSASVRASAMHSLASLYPPSSYTDEIPADHGHLLARLLKLTGDANPKVAKEGALAVAQFLWPEEVQEAILLLKHTDPEVRKAAAAAVARSQEEEGVKPLVSLLKDPDTGVRSEAARLLYVMIILGNEDRQEGLAAELPVEPLVEALNDPATNFRVLELLAASPDPRAAKALMDALSKDRSYQVEGLFVTIAKRKDKDATQLLLAILQSERTTNNWTTWQALQRILDRHDPSVVEPLLEYAKTPDGTWINTDQVLLAFHDPRFVPVLLERLKDQHEDVRVNAAKWLGEYRDERIVPALIAALKDEARAVQYAAAGSLGRLGDSRAVSPLVAMLDFNPGAASLALGDLKVAEAAPKLAALLKNPKTQNRNEIAQAIGKLPSEQAVEALASAAQENEHKDCILQDVLVKELEKFQDARVIQALQRINLDESPPNGCVVARTDASQSLSQRGARPFPPKQ